MSLEHSPTRGVDGPEPDRLIDITEVCRVTSLSRTTIWRLERAGNFARRRRCSPNRVAWLLSQVLQWMSEREAVT